MRRLCHRCDGLAAVSFCLQPVLLPLLTAWMCAWVALPCLASPAMGGGSFTSGRRQNEQILSWKTVSREEKAKTRQQIVAWLQEMLGVLPSRGRAPAQALLPCHGSRGRVWCSLRSGLCPRCRKAQSKVLIKAAVKKQEHPGRQMEKPCKCCGLHLVPTCLKAFHKCVVQRWGEDPGFLWWLSAALIKEFPNAFVLKATWKGVLRDIPPPQPADVKKLCQESAGHSARVRRSRRSLCWANAVDVDVWLQLTGRAADTKCCVNC